MAEPRLAKTIAVGLGAVEFLFGLVFAVVIFFSAAWVAADAATLNRAFFWPVLIAIMLTVVFGPALVAFLAERAKSPRTVYVCLAVLVVYPLALFGWANFYGA